MYFPSGDERRWLEQGVLADARRLGVSDSLRGWNWGQPPLRPIYAAPLDASALESSICPTGRDLYLHGLGVMEGAAKGMVEGAVLKSVAARVVQEAKEAIYRRGLSGVDTLERRAAQAFRRVQRLRGSGCDETEVQLWSLRAFELRRVIERIIEAASCGGAHGSESIIAKALPISVGVEIDGRLLGLSSSITADAICWSEMTVSSIVFGGEPEPNRHRIAGLALALEGASGRAVDVGCVVSVRFVEGHVQVHRDYHLIGDEERQLFVERRDEQMRVVESGVDPGLPITCPRECGHFATCHPRVTWLPEPNEKRILANLPDLDAPEIAIGR